MRTDTPWSYATIWESIAAALPDDAAIVQGAERLTWRRFDAAADALAADLLAAGLGHQAKVAILARNGPGYLIACFAAFKAGLVPINVNYRYGAAEIAYLLDNADAEAVVFDACFAGVLDAVRAGAAGVRRWIAIGSAAAPPPGWAADLAGLPAAAVQPVTAPWGRGPDDLTLLYTGGTTGAPKGVMWRQGDLLARGGYASNPAAGLGPLPAADAAGARAAAQPERPRGLIASPLMHGTGFIAALSLLNFGGTAILLAPGALDAAALWDAVEHEGATRIGIAGQAFAQPMLEALDAHPGRWDLRRLTVVTSSGSMWSRENKAALLRHLPQVQLVDSFSSSEALGIGASVTTATGASATASFVAGPDCAVFTQDGRRVAPGSSERGLVAMGGPNPLGYYKDPEKTARTFPTIEGRRWSMPGDWAEVTADGTLRLLGRGSQCINTGGEKVFPEEVEEALKQHAAVRDAAVLGLEDARFGQRIAAVVELHNGAAATSAALRDHVRSRLAHYKVPRTIVIAESVRRGPNGKLDYVGLRTLVGTAANEASHG